MGGMKINLQGMKLFQLMAKDNASSAENVLFSPCSLFFCLAMLASGSRGQTRQEILDLMRLSDDCFEETLSILQRSLSEQMCDSIHQFRAAYLNECFNAKTSWQDTIRHFFQAALYLLDFSNPAAAADTVNRQIEQHTNGLLKNVLSPIMIQPGSRLILLDTLFFQGKWDRPFEPECTDEDTFFLSDGLAITIPMMYQKGWFPYFCDAKQKIHGVVLPYKGNDCELVAIMPTADKIPLQNVLDCLADGWLAKWLDSAGQKKKTEVYLPRMNLKSSTDDIIAILKTAGMVTAFTDQADLSGITEDVPLQVDKILQSIKLEVDECGTKAAAATFDYVLEGCPPPMEIKYNVFRADHPFVVLIYNKKVNAVLFACAIQNPRLKENEEV